MYELYWLSKDLCRCSVEKTFPKYGDLILFNSSSLALLTSSLSCDNKELRNGDIFHLASSLPFPESLVSVLFYKILNPQLFWPESKIKVINAHQVVHQVG